MKEGPIGRGRGTPDAARQQLAAMEIAEQATRAPMTPEEARRNRRVVPAGQTSPDRPELDIDALLEAKRRRDAKLRAEASVMSEYASADSPTSPGGTGWDERELREMKKKFRDFLRDTKAK